MPQIIDHIDAIARKKKRDVLLVRFSDPDQFFFCLDEEPEAKAERAAFIAHLEANGIAWLACADIAYDDGMVLGYQGQIYVDLPYDEADPVYRVVADYLETPDGELRRPGVSFWLMTLAAAMKNAHHDEPGYWEMRAEDW